MSDTKGVTLSELESTIRNFNDLTENTYTVQNTLLRLETVYLNSDSANQLCDRSEQKTISNNIMYLLDLLDLICKYK